VTSVLYVVVRQIRCRRCILHETGYIHTMYTYNIVCNIQCIHTILYAMYTGATPNTPYLEPLPALWVAGPCRPHRSSLLILGPAGWSVLRCDSPDALSLVLAYEATPWPDSSCPGKSDGPGQSQPDSPPASQAAGALAVRQCQNNIIRDISTNCVNQSDNCL
jgi:hypothetical protein